MQISNILAILGKAYNCPGWKFGNLRKLRNFSEIFKSEFSILPIGQNWKLGNKKTRNNISETSEVSEFSICQSFIFQKTFFSIFYGRQFCTSCLCYVLFSKPFKVFFSFTENICLKYYFVVMRYICCEMYLHSWGHGVCWFEIQWKVLTFPMLNIMETIKIWSTWKLSEVFSFG